MMNANTIKITKNIHGFAAEDSAGLFGGGRSAAEALGTLVMSNPERFGITLIAYDTDSATMQYILTVGRDRIIYERKPTE